MSITHVRGYHRWFDGVGVSEGVGHSVVEVLYVFVGLLPEVLEAGA